MADFVGLEKDEDQLRSAVIASSFENMLRLELERGRPGFSIQGRKCPD
jgi:hypothetical protein